MPKGKLTCQECGRTFSMPAHLARHLSGSHGIATASKKTAARTKPGRAGKRRGRMPAAVARLNLHAMSVEELSQIMLAAKSEVERRISTLQEVLA